MSEKIDVLGVGFDNLTMDEAVDAALAEMGERKAAYVVTPNPEIVMDCRCDPEAAAAVDAAALTIPDGIGILYGAKLLKTPLKEKIPGCDFTLRLMERMDAGKRVYILGGKPGVAEQAVENLRTQFPHLRFVGAQDGYFKDDAPVVAAVNAAAPDLLLVCLAQTREAVTLPLSSAHS